MTKEKLLEWGLTEEQATKVMEGLNGSFVTKARFNEVNTELTAAKNTIKERDTQLETLKKASGDTKALQDQITQLQADNKKKDADHAAELKNLKIRAYKPDSLMMVICCFPEGVSISETPLSSGSTFLLTAARGDSYPKATATSLPTVKKDFGGNNND